MKESRKTSKGMWWDGQYGGVFKNGTFLMLYIKPVLPTIDKYDEMSCWPNAPSGDDMCYTIYHEVKAPLSQDHIDYISGVIDAAIPDAGGGGGGGGDPKAIIAIDGSSADSLVRITRSDGSSGVVDFGNTIQSTPAYVLGFNVVGTVRNGKMLAGTDPNEYGIGFTGYGGPNSKDNRVYIPHAICDQGGLQKGGTYDAADGSFRVTAANVEIKVQVAYIFGFHPDWPSFSQGRPVGTCKTGYWVERYNDTTGEWEDVQYVSVSHGSQSSVPNSSTPSWNTASSTVTIAGPKPAKYRIGHVIEELNNGNLTADDFKYLRLWAYPNTYGDSLAKNYWQLTGSIKDVSEYEQIPSP